MKQTTRWILFFLFWIPLPSISTYIITKSLIFGLILIAVQLTLVIIALHVPRKDESGNVYSIVGRIKVLQLK